MKQKRKGTRSLPAASLPRDLPRQVRIIGGKWRGRRLDFPAVAAIRPTPDRVRETVFNWLMPAVSGARCLDLFAGSGALGFEALSRGAREAVFVDRDPRVAGYLRETLARLKADEAEVVGSEAGPYLDSAAGPFDIVFLDPPFGQGMLEAVCGRLDAKGLLGQDAYVYIENEAEAGAPVLPAGWTLHRTGHAGKVGYHLARARGPA